MIVIAIYMLIACTLFTLSFIARRRFGLLGLALAAGSLLSGIWGYDAELVAGFLGAPSGPLTSAVVLSIIVLLPASALLFHGYAYKKLIGRIIGAILFTVLALAFLIEPLGHALVPQGFGENAYLWIESNRAVIIGWGMIIAVVDIFLTKPVKPTEKSKH
jgi:hypothetical protein